MTEKNWALEAIEKEAENRVWARLSLMPDTVPLLVFGLTIKQIRLLMLFYEQKTGNRPSTIEEFFDGKA